MGKKIYITESQLDYIIKNVDLLNEQEQPAQGGDCASLIFKGTQISIQNFGKILSCGSTTLKNFWESKSDNEKKYVLDTLLSASWMKLANHGISTHQYGKAKGSGGSYHINKGAWNQSKSSGEGIKRGDKPGTGGYNLNENNQIFLVNGSSIGLANGFNGYGDYITKLNEYNRSAFGKNKPPVQISKQGTNKEAVGVYKNLGYTITPMKVSPGVLVYYPVSDAKLQKVDTKPGEPKKEQVPHIKFGNERNPFADNDTRLNDELYNELVQDLGGKISDPDIKIDSITIQSSASNENTSYKKGGTPNYKNNEVLAKDRGDALYLRLKKQFGNKLPPLKDGKVDWQVEKCENLDANGRCLSKHTESEKYVNIIYNGIKTKSTEEDVKTNKGTYTYTQWELKRFK